MRWLGFTNTHLKSGKKESFRNEPYVTIGWDGLPTISKDGYVLPRRAELIINARYYPNWPEEIWPVDPETGMKLNTKTTL